MSALAAFTVAMVVAVPGAGAVSLDDLEEAERTVDDLQVELDRALESFERTLVEIELVTLELDGLARRARQIDATAAEAERLLSERARVVFKQGSGAPFEALLSSAGPQQAVERAAMISTLQAREGNRLERAVAAREQQRQIRLLVVDRQQRLVELQARLDVESVLLATRLSSAQDRAHSIRTMVSRQKRIERGVQQGIYACIFDNAFSFRDTWGDPRSGGRRHRGTDVMAPRNHPVYAFTSGVVQRTMWSGLGGLVLYLRGDDGNVYLYAHLNSVVDGMVPGRRVSAGELIARNGSTGNAPASAPHVHFELHPGGGGAVNPYPWLVAACR